jgi:hypothetical protein
MDLETLSPKAIDLRTISVLVMDLRALSASVGRQNLVCSVVCTASKAA